MKFIPTFFYILWIAASPATAQIELVSGDYFPAELEFAELQKVLSSERFEDPARLATIENGSLLSDVGFSRYAKRVYSVGNKGSLSVEIITLLDARAAFSLSTLLRSGDLQDGPPGYLFTSAPDGILFCQGRIWVRIQGHGTAEDLPKRIAISVSNRIGPVRPKPPSLVSHMPKQGYDRSTLRYYPGIKAYAAYSRNAGGIQLHFDDIDAEIAQARYTLDNRTGTLSLLSFPTQEVAEEYFAGLARKPDAQDGNRSYAKRAGPIVGILKGPFDAGTADKILRSIQYSYSIQWVYEKGNKPKTVWGVPAGILGTVVKSLFFVAILFGLSILIGICFAATRAILRRRAPKRPPDQPDPTEITRLRMQ
jgi:hypothetical protein